MREIRPDNFGPGAKELIAKAFAEGRPRTLKFAPPAAEVRAALEALTDQTVSNKRRVRMPHDADALRAGLWLLFDFMDESHDISQKLATPSGSYWHGILHRREGDASNAKYWFNRVGDHPVFAELLADAGEIAAGVETLANAIVAVKSWDAPWFVDRCMSADRQTTPVLLEIQRREWLLLFEYNFKKAFA